MTLPAEAAHVAPDITCRRPSEWRPSGVSNAHGDRQARVGVRRAAPEAIAAPRGPSARASRPSEKGMGSNERLVNRAGRVPCSFILVNA